MLDSKIAADIIDTGLERGADFVDVFVEKNVSSAISFGDSQVRDIKTGTDFGIGIRLIFGKKAMYGYTNQLEREELLRITHLLSTQESAKSSNKSGSLQAKSENSVINQALHGLNSDYPINRKVSLLRSLDKNLRAFEKIVQVDITALQRLQNIQIFNSESLMVSEERHYTRLATSAIAQDGNEQSRAYLGPGGTQGWECVEGLDPEELAEILAKRAITVLHAKPCPAGKMPVIIDNGFGGVIFHEACGHLLETTSVEKKASVFHDKMGEMIAHPSVNAVDDGTITGMWGTTSFDDEGTKTGRTQLIKDGRLVNFLVDRMGEIKTGHKRSGSGRRQSYKFAPASRMRNTFIEPGSYSFDDLISSVDKGIYAKVMGGGSVSPGTGDFNFAIEEAYLINDGKIGEAVKGATLIGSGPDTLQKISMVGSNFSLSPGMCGSVSGSIPVTVGQAALKVDEILVGGEAS